VGLDSEMTTNMCVLKPSRVKLKQGNIFTLSICSKYYFGRIISREALAGWSMPRAILIYIFCGESQEMTTPDRSVMRLDNLLIPPVMTNTLPWSRGYFQTLRVEPLGDKDILPRHCFRSSNGKYYDEFANEIDGPVEPCGDWGLHSFKSIDDSVSDALGIPLAD
jgi:hypothetical protein